MTPRLQVRGLSVALEGRRVVAGLDLEVGAGEIVGLVGPSGSGKSLTARAIAGLAPRGAEVGGSVRLDGRELLGMDERALCAVRGRGVGLVFQEPSTALDPVMSIGEQMAEGLRLHDGASRRAARKTAADWLERVGLDAAAVPPGRRPHQLSGGQRQRVAIAAAVALRPAVLLADEPTTALDAVTQAQIATLLARLAREEAMSLLLISHDLALVASLADRLVVIENGRAVAAGGVAELLAEPHTQVRTLRQAATAPPTRPARAGEGPPVLRAVGLRRLYAASDGWRRLRTADEAGVHDVSLVLHRGERLAVVGQTGAGKSTLLRLILGLERPDAGQVFVGEEAFAPAPAARRRSLRRHIQPVFQDPAGSFDPLWTVQRIVAEPLGLAPAPLSAAEVAERVGETLRQVGLGPEYAARPARTLSGGQRQRLALARALVIEPDILVLDEATSALDLTSRGEILELLAELGERVGLACLIVTHDLAVVRTLADRVAVLQAGRIVETGAVEGVFAAPRHPHTRALLDAAPDLERALAGRPRRARPQPAD